MRSRPTASSSATGRCRRSTASTSTSRPAPCSACWGPTGPASRRPSASSRRSQPRDAGTARVAGFDVRARAAAGAAGDRRRRPEARLRPRGHGPREPRPAGRALRDRATLAPARATSCSSASGSPTPPTARPRPTRGGMQRRLDVALGLDPPPAGAVPRRADDRARPRGAGADVGRDRAPGARGADDDPAHHALPRGGRPARLAAGDRRPRADRRARDAGRAQGRTGRRRRAGRAGERATAGPRRPRWSASAGWARCWSRAARCTPARPTARRRSPPCWRRSRPTGCAPRRSRSRGRRWTTSICVTPAGPTSA